MSTPTLLTWHSVQDRRFTCSTLLILLIWTQFTVQWSFLNDGQVNAVLKFLSWMTKNREFLVVQYFTLRCIFEIKSLVFSLETNSITVHYFIKNFISIFCWKLNSLACSHPRNELLGFIPWLNMYSIACFVSILPNILHIFTLTFSFFNFFIPTFNSVIAVWISPYISYRLVYSL